MVLARGQIWFYILESMGPKMGPLEDAMTKEILTISVPEAGQKYFGLSRNGSYAEAERGEIPTIKIGRLKRVPVRAMERLFDGVERTGADAT